MRFIAIAGGKGGVGKTTVAINLATALTKYGRQVILLDASFDFPNVGLMLGKSNFEETIISCIEEKKDINSAVFKHQSGIKIIPGSISLENFYKRDIVKFNEVLQGLKGKAEAVLLDIASGLNKDNLDIIKSCHDIVVVTTPDFVSVTECLKLIKVAKSHKKNILGIVVNRFSGKDYDMKLENMHTLLNEKIIAVIPEHKAVKESLKLKYPVVYSNPNSPPAIAYEMFACNMIGRKYKPKEQPKKGKLDTVLDKVGIKKWYESLMEEDDDE